jgi:hypothetical protein
MSSYLYYGHRGKTCGKQIIEKKGFDFKLNAKFLGGDRVIPEVGRKASG